MRQKRKRWTPEEDLELKRLFDLGCYTSVEIAEKLGCRKSQIDTRKHKLGLTAIKLSAKNPAHVAQLIKFRMAGWTQEKIGEVFGVTHAYISYFLCQNGFRNFFTKYPKRNRYKNTLNGVATYYHCTQRDRYGIPIVVERHIYENGELKKVENC